MCGINGFTFQNQELIRVMNQLTAHRGPDQTDAWVGEQVSLGHNRLAILDLSPRGAQPMWDAAQEVVIVFNGEIYNFQELRNELQKKYQFQSTSDTEVILYAYREYGIDCVKKFNGIFALALWDTRTRELFLARDHVGVKPLYYFLDGKRLIFSSEIKAILAHDIPREVDPDAFNLYFQVLYVPEPYTMFSSIKKLPPASYLRWHDGDVEIKKYWEVNDFSNLTSRSDAEREILRLFRDSVKHQLISDRPVGVFLSGGMDSTAVLGAVAERTQEQTKTYSVGFADSTDPDKFNADFFLARQTAEFYKTDHHELMISANDIKNNLEDIVWHLDEPNANPTAGVIYLLSKEAKKDVAVVLGGDGGDELFGGYPRYYFSHLISWHKRNPAIFKWPGLIFQAIARVLQRGDMAQKLSLPPNEQRILAFLAQKDSLLSSVLVPGAYQSYAARRFFAEKYFTRNEQTDDFEKQFMNIDRQSWLVDESLLRTDKMTMAFGLEARVPILDYRLVKLANRIPTLWKLNVWTQWPKDFQGKRIWKQAIAQYLPPHVLNQKKRGWFTPMAKWVRGDLKDTVSEILSPTHLNSDYFDARAVQRVWRGHLDGTEYNLNIIWAIVMWQLWYDRFIKKII